MRIFLVGGGELAYALARTLAPDHDLTVVDLDRGVAERFGALDVGFAVGSGTDAAVLERAGVDEAALLVACTGQDEVNAVVCAVARRIASPQTICLVSRDDFLRPFGEGTALRDHFGIDHVLWPEAQLADDIERIIEAPGAIDAESFAEGRVRLLEYRVADRTYLASGPLSSLDLPAGSLIVAYKRDQAFGIPRGTTQLLPGDKVILMGTPEAMEQVQARVAPGVPGGGRQRVTIVGGGDVGFRLARRLDTRPSIDLRVIERDQRRGELLAAALGRTLVLQGDGTDLELLETEGIGQSDVLVSVIDNDEKNLFVSLLGRQLGVKKTITRVSRPANLRLFERVGIDVALSARGAAVAAIAHRVRGGSSDLLAVLEEGQAKVVDLTVPDTFAPIALRQLRAPRESIVGAIRRPHEVIVPRGNDTIGPGDHLLVFTTANAADEVRDLFVAAAD